MTEDGKEKRDISGCSWREEDGRYAGDVGENNENEGISESNRRLTMDVSRGVADLSLGGSYAISTGYWYIPRVACVYDSVGTGTCRKLGHASRVRSGPIGVTGSGQGRTCRSHFDAINSWTWGISDW